MTDHLESGHCVNFGEMSFRIHHGGSVCLLFILLSVVGVEGVFRFGPPLSSWGGFRSFDLLLFLFSLSYYFLLPPRRFSPSSPCCVLSFFLLSLLFFLGSWVFLSGFFCQLFALPFFLFGSLFCWFHGKLLKRCVCPQFGDFLDSESCELQKLVF